MSAYAKRVAIAAGFNNKTGLTQLHKLQVGQFENYKKWVENQFSAFEFEELSLARKYKRFGLPSCVWIFEAISTDELNLLLSYIPSGFDTGEVTIRTLDNTDGIWKNYSALLKRPVITQNNWNGYEYRDIQIEFYDLKVIA